MRCLRGGDTAQSLQGACKEHQSHHNAWTGDLRRLTSGGCKGPTDIDQKTEQGIKEAPETLAVSKVRQAEQANRRRVDETTFSRGELVLNDLRDQRQCYKLQHNNRRAAKLFQRWVGPFEVVEAFSDTPTYRLRLTHDDKSHPVFRVLKRKLYNLNNADNFPSRKPPRPGPIALTARRNTRNVEDTDALEWWEQGEQL
ncbi:Reverse transcriptase-RNase H-integrase [Rhodotorula toruloides ATCC 204091]|nr:Reverse transcriptase-RNase H-integrase [Rhodotorula toruloides ATCC 204091]